MRHAVVIASTRRPDILGATLATVMAQSVAADEVVLSLADRADAPDELPTGVRVVIGPRGLTRQRNAGLDALSDEIELVTFFDDDAEPAADYLEKAQAFAAGNPAVVLFDGKIVADGAVTGEIDRAHAGRLLQACVRTEGVRAQPEAYGCNMNVRLAIAQAVRFDERLPLYGWLEDRDFAIRCARHGEVALYEGCLAVHLGTSSGRVSGHRMGFSQIVNPHYLWRKEVLKASQLLHFWSRALLGNAHGLASRDPLLDRAGRLRGNLTGLLAVVRGLGPEAVLDVDIH
jgi:GT2 family glycosyltransferase